MIDVSLILFILFDYLRIPWNPIKSNHAKIKRKRGHFITVVLRAAVILNMTTVEDNYVRYCQNFKKRYLNQILES